MPGKINFEDFYQYHRQWEFLLNEQEEMKRKDDAKLSKKVQEIIINVKCSVIAVIERRISKDVK